MAPPKILADVEAPLPPPKIELEPAVLVADWVLTPPPPNGEAALLVPPAPKTEL